MEKATLLVVDDNLTNLQSFLEYLERAGFQTFVAPGAEKALQQLKHLQPDLILLDVLMPEIDGFETCVRLKSNKTTKEIPVIFMTALSDTVDKVKGFEVGGIDYITKPFQYEEVVARLRTHLTTLTLQQKLKHQTEELKKRDANKDKFLAMIAHDLRSPFSSLRGLIQFAAQNIEEWDTRKIQEILGLLSNSTDNLYALIENLLTWSRLQLGMMEFRPEILDLRKIIIRNIELFKSVAEQKQITVQHTVHESIPVYGDINMIEVVVRNLLSNALKFTHPDGKVNVTVTQNTHDVTFAISDTGIGLSKKNSAKLFRIDARYKQLGTSREKGTGLGLILCKEFIERNGGKVSVESEFGKGSTFFFTLPKNSPKA